VPQLGFIGIGTMGAPMVHCMAQSGLSPLIYDAVPDVAHKAGKDSKLQVASRLSEVGEHAGIVILMLPNSKIVETVCLGAGGVARSMAPGSIIVDMSSSDPIRTRKLGAALQELDVTLLDAPVSGGLRKAIDGSLAIMLGGDDIAAMDLATPVLESMGKVFPAGGLAAGHATKALNNYVSAAGLAAACEAVLIGQEFGLDPERLIEIINASTGRNNSTENKVRQFILSENFKGAGFGLGLMAKDVGLAASLSDHVGQNLPGVRAAADMWRAAEGSLEKGADHTEIFSFLARHAK
tara:strand:+ start:1375 stop:2256 length:882 start_codon:yes stop_codon:yes gene_type:complete